MNILDILVSAISKTDNAQCGDIEEVIRGVPCRKSDTESKYRNRLEKAFVERLDVKPKRESGISRLGTRLDLFFVYKDVDYIITIKMGLTEQKVKNVLGEIVLVIGG